jgi:hypothetical protein
MHWKPKLSAQPQKGSFTTETLSCSAQRPLCGGKGVKQQLAYLPRFKRDGWMMGAGQETLFHWVPVPYLNSTRVNSISVFITYLLTMH